MNGPGNLIRVGINYALGSDEISVTLYKRRIVKKNRKVAYDPIGYFPTYEQALHRLVDRNLQASQDICCKFSCILELKNFITEAIERLAQNPSPADHMTKTGCRMGYHKRRSSSALNGLKSKQQIESENKTGLEFPQQ